jgi:hypothetical protein
MRRLLLPIVCAAALLAAGCGTEDYVRVAETEGVYVDVGDLTYQVQISRFLNPGNLDDREYLEGLGGPEAIQLPGDQIWFGVFMRVKNYSDVSSVPSSDFTIKDTQGEEYRPIALPDTNPFAYHPGSLGPSQVYPYAEGAAANGPIQGSLILFKLKTDSLQNRPLKLFIAQAGEESAEIDLDL